MSTATKKKPVAKRKRSTPTLEIVEEEPTTECFAMWREVGLGYRSARIQLPRSIVEHYAVEVTEPEIKQITLAKLVRELEKVGT